MCECCASHALRSQRCLVTCRVCINHVIMDTPPLVKRRTLGVVVTVKIIELITLRTTSITFFISSIGVTTVLGNQESHPGGVAFVTCIVKDSPTKCSLGVYVVVCSLFWWLQDWEELTAFPTLNHGIVGVWTRYP